MVSYLLGLTGRALGQDITGINLVKHNIAGHLSTNTNNYI